MHSVQQRSYGSTNILGVRIDKVSMPQAVSVIGGMFSDGGCYQIVTVNPEFIMTARVNGEFRDVLNGSALSVPDGIGIILASKIRGLGISERVTGVDLVTNLAASGASKGIRIFFLGGRGGVAERAAGMLRDRFPGLVVAGIHEGSPDPAEEGAICEMISKTKPHLLLVAYGAPKQDLWIARNQKRIGVPVAIGIGGTFDFIAGTSKRAPDWVQAIGMEWFHRLVREPYRWRRMLALPRFAVSVLLEAVTG
jgi:N-acetylglucosaminyldiphosphoundecaprenol N-acetyl-beta-D-mannosaminyltransferase